MKTTQSNRSIVSSLPALQQELTDFVTRTEQRLQALAGGLSLLATPPTAEPAAEAETMPRPWEPSEQSAPVSFELAQAASQPTADPHDIPDRPVNPLHPGLDASEPLARLQAIKQRIAARIDQHDANH